MTADDPRRRPVPPALQRLWERRRDPICDRIDRLATGLRAWPNGLDAEDRADLIVAAHQLHGLLGTYGLETGSDLAGAAEALLQSQQPDADTARELGEQLAALIEQLRGSDSGQGDRVGR